jgi:outer membrane lipoprotein-sorting protein
MKKIDVFISRKSSDAKFAKAIYDYLTLQGLVVFDSAHTLKEIGNADYIKAIDEALATTTHMIVVGSSAENIKSSWVEAEWLFFLNRKRSGKTSGNLFTVITSNFKLEDVPPSLANYEVIPFNEKNFSIIYNYVRQENSPAQSAPKKPFPAEKQNRYLWLFIGILIAGILSAAIYLKLQPYDATVFLKPDTSLKLQSSYPAFKGGELSIFINNKEEKKEILSNGEVIFKQIAASAFGEKVAIKLHANNWKLRSDSMVLEKLVNLNMVPDGSLAAIIGNIKNNSGQGIENVNITIDGDTTIASDKNGIFNIVLPSKFQKSNYTLSFQKEGYQPLKEYYYPKSGNIDIRMKLSHL